MCCFSVEMDFFSRSRFFLHSRKPTAGTIGVHILFQLAFFFRCRPKTRLIVSSSLRFVVSIDWVVEFPNFQLPVTEVMAF